MQQLFAVMTAVQISLEILLNQMRESSVYYHLLIDSDKCWAHSDVSMMKKALGKALDNVTPDKVARQTSANKWKGKARRILIPIVRSLQWGRR